LLSQYSAGFPTQPPNLSNKLSRVGLASPTLRTLRQTANKNIKSIRRKNVSPLQKQTLLQLYAGEQPNPPKRTATSLQKQGLIELEAEEIVLTEAGEYVCRAWLGEVDSDDDIDRIVAAAAHIGASAVDRPQLLAIAFVGGLLGAGIAYFNRRK
jgi:hypothetical protein